MPLMAEQRNDLEDRSALDDAEFAEETHVLLAAQKTTPASSATAPRLTEEPVQPAASDRLPWYIAYFFHDNGEGDVRIIRAILAAVFFLTISITLAVALICVRHGHAHPAFELWLPSFLRPSHGPVSSAASSVAAPSASLPAASSMAVVESWSSASRI